MLSRQTAICVSPCRNSIGKKPGGYKCVVKNIAVYLESLLCLGTYGSERAPSVENKSPYRSGPVCRSHGSCCLDCNLGWYSLRAREGHLSLACLICLLLAQS